MKLLLSILIIYLSLFMPEPTHIAEPNREPFGTEQKYEYYDTTGGTPLVLDNNPFVGIGQVFMIGTTGENEDHKATKIKVYLQKVNSPGDVTITLYEASPSIGEAIGTGTIAEGDISEGGWVECIINSSKILVKDEFYAFGITCPGADASNYVTVGISDNGYIGEFCKGMTVTTVGGWVLDTSDDLLFEIWGKKSKLQTATPTHIGEPTH